MSFLSALTVVSFHRYNPDWRIIVYVPKEKYRGGKPRCLQHCLDYTGEDYFHLVKGKPYVEINVINTPHYGIRKDLPDILRSDIFRYKILHEFGGVWSDFDVLWLKPISELCNVDHVGISIKDMSGLVCMYETTFEHHNIGVMVHSKGCAFLKSLISKTSELQKGGIKLRHQMFGVCMLNSMYPAFDRIKINTIAGVKYETFYPYSIYNMKQLWKENDLKPIESRNVLCVHWFNGHELSKEYINNGKYNLECSMTSILKKENYEKG